MIESTSNPESQNPEIDEEQYRKHDRVARLAKNFEKVVTGLPKGQGQHYIDEQRELAQLRRDQQMSEGRF